MTLEDKRDISSLLFCLLVCVCVCVSPHNLGTISENLHVNVAGPVGLSHNVDLIEFSLRS